MATLPYLVSPGSIDKAFEGIKAAAVPTKVSQDFVKTVLKIPGGSGDRMTAFLKKIGMVSADGSPGELYAKFRNPASSGHAVAQAVRHAYAPLYRRNEFMHKLSDQDLTGLVVEETGQAADSNPVRLIVSTIKRLKQFADFEVAGTESTVGYPLRGLEQGTDSPASEEREAGVRTYGLNLGYTINLNLPATSDPAVFNAIFKSLKKNFLGPEDA